MNKSNIIDWSEIEKEFRKFEDIVTPFQLCDEDEFYQYKLHILTYGQTKNYTEIKYDYGVIIPDKGEGRKEDLLMLGQELGFIERKGSHLFPLPCREIIKNTLREKQVTTEFLTAWGYYNQLVGQYLELVVFEKDSSTKLSQKIQSIRRMDITINQYWQCSLDTGKLPAGTHLIPMLGAKKVTELTTADIRAWHKLIWDKVGSYTANQSKQYLSAIFGLLAEDFNVKPPAIPKRTEKRRKEQKKILTQEQFKILLGAAHKDEEYGLYYAFPFLTGVRSCEQLGLLWSEVDFEKRVIRICRIQERNGLLTEFTKTEASKREIPMSQLVYDWLLRWQERCPVSPYHPARVFPNLGRLQQWPQQRKEGGKCLLYSNFRGRVWKRALEKIGLPHVTPHSARHFFISTLQAKGIEIGLVSKLAGHANPTVTLGH